MDVRAATGRAREPEADGGRDRAVGGRDALIVEHARPSTAVHVIGQAQQSRRGDRQLVHEHVRASAGARIAAFRVLVADGHRARQREGAAADSCIVRHRRGGCVTTSVDVVAVVITQVAVLTGVLNRVLLMLGW